MEPKFTIQSKYTEEEFVRFNREVLFKSGRFKRTIIMMNVSLIVLGVAAAFYHSDFKTLIPIILLLAFVNWYFFKGVNLRAARAFKQNAAIRDKVFTLSFYDDHYEGASDDGTTSILYSNLHKIIETPTNFYILHGPMNGTILQKGNCPPAFVDFILEVKRQHHI